MSYEDRRLRGRLWFIPTSAQLTLKLVRSATSVAPRGGGALPANGNISGWRLAGKRVNGSLTVPAYGGVVLLT